MHNAMPSDRTDRRVNLLNGRFDPLTMDETIDRVAALLESDQRSWLCTVNVAILMMMREDPELHRFVERAMTRRAASICRDVSQTGLRHFSP